MNSAYSEKAKCPGRQPSVQDIDLYYKNKSSISICRTYKIFFVVFQHTSAHKSTVSIAACSSPSI
jgi:hypothetical protein